MYIVDFRLDLSCECVRTLPLSYFLEAIYALLVVLARDLQGLQLRGWGVLLIIIVPVDQFTLPQPEIMDLVINWPNNRY